MLQLHDLNGGQMLRGLKAGSLDKVIVYVLRLMYLNVLFWSIMRA